MQKQIHVTGSWVLSFLLAFTPFHGHATTSPLVDSKLDDRAYMARELVMYDVAKVKTIPQFVDVFAAKRSGAEKSELLQRLQRLGQFPHITRAENGFLISTSVLSLKIEIQNIQDKKFLVNGLEYTWDSKLSLTEQADRMGRLLKESDPRRYSRFSLFISEAHAVAPLVAIAIGALTMLGTSLVNLAIGHYGNSALEAMDWWFCAKVWKPDISNPGRNPKICQDYLKERDAILKSTPENAAVKNALSSHGSKGEVFSTVNEKCPHETQDQYYRADIRILREQQDSSKIKDEQINVLGEFAGGKLKHIKVYEAVYEEGALKQKLIATYQVDSDAVLSNIVLSEDLKISALADLKDDPKMQAEQAFHKSIFSYIGSRFSVCKIKKQEREAVQIEANSAAQNTKKISPSIQSGAK